MSAYIHQIYSAFHDLPDSHFLIIKGSKEHGYSFSASAIDDVAVAVSTQQLLKKIFSEYPIREILEQHPHPKLTKATLRQVFVKMAVFGDKGPPLDFSTLAEFEHVFLDQAPEEKLFLEDKAKTSGKGFEGLCEKVYLQWHHYFATQSEHDPKKVVIRQAEFLTSRMADREFQEGMYVYLAKGEIFQVDKTVICDGAYIAVLKNIADPTRVKIICRGTAMRRTATDGFKSGLNDLQYEIGNGGIQGAWHAIAAYFHQENIREVEIYGKSLGGGHAQRLAVLVMKHSHCLLKGVTTVCSVGAGPEAEALFKDLIERDERYRNLNLTVIRNGGEEADRGADYIPCIGGDHLGATVDPGYLNLRVYYIHPTSKEVFPPHQDLNFFQKGIRFLSSFSGPHLRQSTLLDFSYQQLDRHNAQLALKLGTTLEGPRRILAYKNTRSFTDFVHSPSHVVETLSVEKVVLVVSCVFLVLFFIGFMTCLVLHPGAIVYQDSGIILTIPTIIMGGGVGISLLAIAIGSCSLWLSARRRVNEQQMPI